MPKDAFYFPHDCNARHDPKILKMRSAYNLQGLGLYWALVEMMREQENYMLPLDDESVNGYALDLNCPADLLNSFIDDCVARFKLFVADDKYLWSLSLQRRMERFDNKSEQARNAAILRWNKSKRNADAIPTQSERNTKRVYNKRSNNIIRDNNIPHFLNKEIWFDYLDMRKKMRKPPTDRAIEFLIKDLEKYKEAGDEPNEVLKQSIKNSWIGVFPLRKDNGTHKTSAPRSQPKQYTKPEEYNS